MQPKEILLGTVNQAKVDHIRLVAAEWPITIHSPQDLNITLDVIEDGDTAEANAVKKALEYATAANLPTLAIDAALLVDGFPPEKQPGVFVRRIYRDHGEVSDAEIMRHYIAELDACGGSSAAHWEIAIALVKVDGQVFTKNYAIETRFVNQPCTVQIPSAPLSSLMVDPVTNRYYAEMPFLERPDSVQLREALSALFAQI